MTSHRLRIFITGGSGMVGRAVVEELRDRYDLFAPSRAELDLMDRQRVRSVIRDFRPGLVVHLAAKVGGIQANIADPVGFLVENMRVNVSVLMAALESEVERLIFMGSSCMYPKDLGESLSEEMLLTGSLEPTNEGYALSKLLGSRFCQYASEQYGVLYRTVIPPNLYGPYDTFDPSRSHLVAAAILKTWEAVGDGHRPVKVWGDGSARREYLYVADLAGFLRFALETTGLESLPPVLNVGVGSDRTVIEYYTVVGDLLGFKGEFLTDPGQPAGMRRKLLDSAKVRALGWEPRTDFRDGLRKTIDYFMSHCANAPRAFRGA